MENTPARKKYVNLRWMIPGFIILCNPEIAGFDFLPDFFGYLCIMIGLYYLADMNSKLKDAMHYVRKLCIVSAIQFGSFIIVLSLSSASEQSTAYLCITFAVMFFSILFGIPAWKSLFDGFSYVSMKYESKAADGRLFAFTKVFTIVFIVCKPFLPFLAELTSLSIQDYQTGKTSVNWYEHIDFYRFLGTGFILAFGIVWLTFILRSFRNILKESELMSKLTAVYEQDIKPCTGMFLLRRLRVAYYLLAFALIFRIEVIIDGVNILPSVVSPILMILAILVLRPYLQTFHKSLISFGLYLISAVGYGYAENAFNTLMFSGRYDTSAAQKTYFVLSCVFNVFFIIATFFLIKFIVFCTDKNLSSNSVPGRFDASVCQDEKGKMILLAFGSVIPAGFSAVSALIAINHPSFTLIAAVINAIYLLAFIASLKRNYDLFYLRFKIE